MTQHQEVVARRRISIEAVVDLAVGRIDADFQNFDQHATTVRDIVQSRLGQIGKMNAVGVTRFDGNRFHDGRLSEVDNRNGKWAGTHSPERTKIVRSGRVRFDELSLAATVAT